MPKISIVTPSYNHARFLPDRVNSILGQTFQDFEWIIIDDCSTDGSQDVLRELVGDDPRVTLLFHSQNQGMPATTREAIALSSGKYIYRAESDDVCDVRFLERMVQVLDAHPQVGFAYCRALHMDENGNLWGGLRQDKQDWVRKGTDVFRSLVMGNFIPGPNIVFRREAHDRVGGFGTGPFTVSCDYHFCLRMCLYYGVAYVSEPLGYHRTHSSNLSGAVGRTYDLDLLFRESYELLLDIFDSIPDEQSDLRDLKRPALRSVTLRHAAPLYVRALLDRRWQVARRILDGVNCYDPGATRGAAWAWACVRGLMWHIGYRHLYAPLSRGLGRRQASVKPSTVDGKKVQGCS